MERSYNRAYRDPKSPLTPLTPLRDSGTFNFDMAGNNSLKPNYGRSPIPRTERVAGPNRCSQNFQKICEMFDKPRLAPCAIKITRNNASPCASPCYCTPSKSSTSMRSRSTYTSTYGCVPDDYTQTSMRQESTGVSSCGCTNYNDYENTPTNHHVRNTHPSTPMPESHIYNSSCKCDQNSNNIYLQVRNKSQQQQELKKPHGNYRQASPIALRPLSPRVDSLLMKAGMCKYRGIFQREEIDIGVFRMLHDSDLEQLGIMSAQDRSKIMMTICYAYKKYCV